MSYGYQQPYHNYDDDSSSGMAIVVILIIVLFIVGGGIGYYMYSKAKKTPAKKTPADDIPDIPDIPADTTPVYTTPVDTTPVYTPLVYTPPTTPVLECASQDIKNKAKQYYETKGEWAGQYTMIPYTIKPRGTDSCDMGYISHSLTNGNIVNHDRRNFIFSYNNGWNPIKMLGYDSGNLAQLPDVGSNCPCVPPSWCNPSDNKCYENCVAKGSCTGAQVPRKNTYYCDYARC